MIQWDVVPDAEWYEVQRETASGGGYARVGMLFRWEMCDEDTGVCEWHGPLNEWPVARDYAMPHEGVLYRYRIRACNGNGCGEPSTPPVEYRGAPYQCYAGDPPREVQCYVGDEVVSR